MTNDNFQENTTEIMEDLISQITFLVDSVMRIIQLNEYGGNSICH